MYIYLLIAIMMFLLINHYIVDGKQSRIIEGLLTKKSDNYQEYNEQNDPLILAKKNAANISYMKDQVDKIDGLNRMIKDLEEKVANNTKNFNDMIEATEQKTNAINESLEGDE
jgi:hypothetical protein